MASNNDDIKITLVADTSDVVDGFKDVEKASDKMSKEVTKDGNKIEDALDDVSKSVKDIQSAFKNIDMKSFTNAMNNVQKQAMNFANAISKMLQEAFNIQGNVDIKTTTDSSSGASGSAMGSVMGSVASGGMIGSQIAKALADSLKQTEKPLKEVPKTFEKNMTQSVSNVGKVIDNVIDNLKSFGIGFDDGSSIFSMFENVESIEDFRATVIGTIDDYHESIKGVQARLETNKQIVADLNEQLAIAEQHNKAFGTNVDVSHITQQMQRWVGTIQFQEEMLGNLKNELQDFCRAKYVLELDQVQAELDELFAIYEQAPTKLNAEAIVSQFEKLKTDMDLLGIDTSFLDEMLKQWHEVRTCTRDLDSFSNSMIKSKQSLDGMVSSSRQFVNEQIKLTQSQKQAKTTTEQLSQAQLKQQQTIAQAKNQMKGFAKEVADACKRIKPQLTNLVKKVKEWGKAHLSVSKQIKSANQGLVSSFKGLLTSMLPFMTIMGAFSLLKDSTASAMDSIESGNMFMAVFGKNAQTMNDEIEKLNKSMGLSVGQTRDFTAIVGQMGSAMGLTSEQAMDLSLSMARMAGDISSFYNTDIVQVQEDLRSALSGSYETMDKYGVVLRQSTIEQFAYANGIARTGAELTNAQRAMATTLYIEQALGQANGDMARTMDTPAGRARRLAVAFDQLKVALGNVVLPIWNAVMPGLIALANALTTVFNTIASVINGILGLFGMGLSIGGGGGGLVEDAQSIGTSLSEGLDDASGGSSDVAKDLADGAKSAEKIVSGLMGIDELNVLSSDKGSGGSGGGSGSGGSGGAGGGGSIGDAVGGAYDIVEQGESIFDTINEKAQAFVDGFKEVWSKIALGFEPYKQNILDQWNLLKLNLQTLGQEIVNFFTSCWENGGSDIAIHLGSLAATITETFLGISNVVVEALTDLFKHLNPENNENVQGFINSFDDMILAIKRFIGQFDEWLQVLKDNGGQEFLDNCADIAFILGTTLMDAFTDLIDTITDFLSEDDNKRVKDFGGALEDVSEALKDISKWVQDNIGWLSVLVALITGLVTGMKLAPAVIGAITLAFQGWGWIVGLIETIGSIFSWLWTVVLVPVGNAIMAGLTAIASFFGISVGWVVAIIAGLVAAGVLLWKNWDTIKEKCKELWTKVCDWWDKTWNSICEACQNISKTCKTKWEEIKTIVVDKCKQLWSNIKTKWNEIKTAIITKCQEIWSSVKTKWEEIKTAVIDKCKQLWNDIKTKWGEIKTAIISKCSEIITSVKTKWEEIKTGIKTKIEQIKTNAKTKFGEIKTTIVDKFNELKAPVEKAIGKVWSAIEPIVDKLTGAFDFDWELPKIKLPSISWTTQKSSLFGFEYPKFSISWNAAGGIFDSPTIFNTGNAGLQGVGEAGAEAIIPISNLWKEMNKNFDRQTQALAKMNGNSTTTVVVNLDGKEVARSTVKNMKEMAQLGNLDTSWL